MNRWDTSNSLRSVGSSSMRSADACFSKMIPPKGWQEVWQMPEVPHQGMPGTKISGPDVSMRFRSPLMSVISYSSFHRLVWVDLPVPEEPVNNHNFLLYKREAECSATLPFCKARYK